MLQDLVKYPIIQAPMAGGASTPKLAATVSAAGGLGFLAAGYKTAEEMRNEIEEVRKLTGRPFGVDCFYFFGNFDGKWGLGTPEEVDLSLKMQKMIANFCKTGNPSIEGYEWPIYNNSTRYKMIFDVGGKLRVEKNPEGGRVEAALNLMKKSQKVRYVDSVASHFPAVEAKYPGTMAEFMRRSMELEEKRK